MSLTAKLHPDLYAEVVAASRNRLGSAGFRKRAAEVFTIDVAEDILGWLGLNRAVRRSDGAVEVNPVVGVRHQAIERTLAALKGEKFSLYVPPTVSLHVGYLTPEGRYQPWLFSNSGVSDLVDEMVDAIEKYGRPFMTRYASLESLVSLMVQGQVGIREQLSYRIPVAYRLLSKEARAQKAMEAALHDLGERHDDAAERFRAFAVRFEEAAAAVP